MPKRRPAKSKALERRLGPSVLDDLIEVAEDLEVGIDKLLQEERMKLFKKECDEQVRDKLSRKEDEEDEEYEKLREELRRVRILAFSRAQHDDPAAPPNGPCVLLDWLLPRASRNEIRG